MTNSFRAPRTIGLNLCGRLTTVPVRGFCNLRPELSCMTVITESQSEIERML